MLSATVPAVTGARCAALSRSRAAPASTSRPAAARPARGAALRVAAFNMPALPAEVHPVEAPRPPPPAPATVPKEVPEVRTVPYGFNYTAERLNGRAAMLGFFSLLLLEAVAGKGIFELMGIDVGNGINIGF